MMHTMASSEHGSERQEHALDLRLIIDSVPALINTSRPDGYLDFFNRTWLKFVGLPLEDLLGWKWTAAIHPADVEGMVDALRRAHAAGRTSNTKRVYGEPMASTAGCFTAVFRYATKAETS